MIWHWYRNNRIKWFNTKAESSIPNLLEDQVERISDNLLDFCNSRNKELEESKNLQSEWISQDDDVSMKPNTPENKWIEEDYESGEIESFESNHSENSDTNFVSQLEV